MSAKIAMALHEVMTKVGYVQKNGKNAFHGYKYAGEADLLDKLRPAMIEAGLILIPSVEHVSEVDVHGNTTVRIEYTLAHKDGDIWPHTVGAAGCGNDRNKNGVGDKGVYKAITGANKYLLFKLFQIETGDDPEATEAAAPQTSPKGVHDQISFERPAASFADEYTKLSLGIIRNFRASADELRGWWASEAPHREEAGIHPGSKQHQELYEAVKAKGHELLKDQSPKGQAA
jgi:hypothetical protein